MKRTFALALGIALIAATGVWAQLAIGATGAVYATGGTPTESIVDDFKNGEGVFYGPLIEIGMRNMALGASFNWSKYTEYFGATPKEMIDWDLNGYVQGHLFGYKAAIDPFLEAGFGMMAKDYADPVDAGDDPLLAVKYFQAGAGLGINLGALGVFAKVLYMIPTDTVESSTGMYLLEEYPLEDLKVFVGAKLMLGR
jgi:hypothetical protein